MLVIIAPQKFTNTMLTFHQTHISDFKAACHLRQLDNPLSVQITKKYLGSSIITHVGNYCHSYIYAVKAQTSLAPLSRFRGSRVTTAHAHQCCRFQSYAKTVPSRMKLTTKLTKREPTFLGSMTMDHVITACDVWLKQRIMLNSQAMNTNYFYILLDHGKRMCVVMRN